MTKAQKKLVSGWLLVLGLVICAIIFGDWIRDHWEIIKFPMLFVIIIAALFGKHRPQDARAEGRIQLNRIVEENPWVKVYLAIYTLLIAIASGYIIFNHIKLELRFMVLFIPIILLVLPIVIIQQKEAYINAGK